MQQEKKKNEIVYFDHLIEYLHRPTVFIDLDGNIMVCNARFAQIVGFRRRQELEGRTVLDFVSLEDRETAISHYEKILLGDGSVINDSYPLTTRTGKKVEKEISGSLLQKEGGIPFGILITVEKSSSESKETRGGSEDVTYMSHELKNPLNAVLGFVQLMKKEKSLSESQREYLQFIEESGMDMLNVIEDLFSRRERVLGGYERSVEFFPLERIFSYVENMGKMLIQQKNKDIQLRRGGDRETDVFIEGDSRRLKRVLINLVENAIKYTDHGFIEYGIEATGEESTTFFVHDTGMGISEREGEFIFDFYRKGDREGLGIGLSVTSELIDEMGGKLFFNSVPDVGSTFYFEIPYVSPKRETDNGAKSLQNLDISWI